MREADPVVAAICPNAAVELDVGSEPRIGDDLVMRSTLVIRDEPTKATYYPKWAFSGNDEARLRDLLGMLDAYRTQVPVERYLYRGGSKLPGSNSERVIEPAGACSAAMLLFDQDVADRWVYGSPTVIQAEAAWTAEGARHLAALLPDELSDLRAAIEKELGSAA